jgi:alkanesulfonate monooxygenase SsuD/methylene tetrahydromethanopterin reductase-like flavin-dependent oxidoreductase (luciferase family)
MRLAASYGQTWVTTGERTADGPLGAEAGARDVRAQVARLEEACAELGRDPASLRRLVLTGLQLDAGLRSVEAFRDTIGRYAEVGVTDLVLHWPRPSEPFAGDVASFERIVSAQ